MSMQILRHGSQLWLSIYFVRSGLGFSGNLVNFSTAVHNKRRVIDNCWDFIDGAARSCCRPEGHEMVFCNGALMAQGCHQVFMFPLYGFSAILSGTFHLVTSRKTLRFL